jgi:hypothetical protein
MWILGKEVVGSVSKTNMQKRHFAISICDSSLLFELGWSKINSYDYYYVFEYAKKLAGSRSFAVS